MKFKKLISAALITALLLTVVTAVPMRAGAYVAPPKGDVNRDGQLTVDDAVLILMKLGGLNPEVFDEGQAQICTEGLITIDDAVQILMYLGGIPNRIDPNMKPKPTNKYKEFTEEVVRLTNIERVNANLQPLSFSFSDNLTSAANVRASETITLFDHTRPDGSKFSTVLQEMGVGWFSAGENIAAGYATPADVVQGWMDSPGHRANILNSSFTHIGVGVAQSGDGQYYWVQVFVGMTVVVPL